MAADGWWCGSCRKYIKARGREIWYTCAMKRSLASLMVCVLMSFAVCGVGGCSPSRVEMLRDRSAMVERKLEAERDRVLGTTGSTHREAPLSHLQSLRLSLSVVNVSITSVPLLLRSDEERAIGYSVLDEAIGTIDWNIPLNGASGESGTARAFPMLFSAHSGLDFAAIRRGSGPTGIAR